MGETILIGIIWIICFLVAQIILEYVKYKITVKQQKEMIDTAIISVYHRILDIVLRFKSGGESNV